MDSIDEFKALQELSNIWDMLNSAMNEFDTAVINVENRIKNIEEIDGYNDLVSQDKKERILEYKNKLGALNV